jgi:hypothetical protein
VTPLSRSKERGNRGRIGIAVHKQGFADAPRNHTSMISMDGKGMVFDNIFLERLWRTFKGEEVCLRD